MKAKIRCFDDCLSSVWLHTVVCVSETWLKPELLTSVFCRNSHTVFRSDRLGRTGGGLLILIPAAFNCSLVCPPVSNPFFESIYVDLYLHAKNKLRLALVYRTPGPMSTVNRDAFFADLSSQLSNRIPMILVGDFNCPTIDWENNRMFVSSTAIDQNLLDFCNENSLEQHVAEPTRLEHILDLVLTTRSDIVDNVSVSTPFAGSDHSTVEFSCTVSPPLDDSSEKRNFSKADFDSMASWLDEFNWIFALSSASTVDEYWLIFKDVLNSLVKRFVPLARSHKKNSGSQAPSWSAETAKFFHRQKRLHHVYTCNKSAAKRARWKAAARDFRRSSRNDSAAKEREILESGDRGSFWRFIRSRVSARPALSVLHDPQGNPVVDSKQKAALISTYFNSVYLPDPQTDHQFNLEPVQPISELSFPPELVYSFLASLQTKFSSGPDQLPSILYKKLALQLALPLSLIFHKSFVTSKLPDEWLSANVVPIHKRNSKSNPANYRPISLTCVACRIMEKLIKVVLLSHLKQKGLISAAQHGFLSNRSTVTQLLQCINDWSVALDEHHAITLIFKRLLIKLVTRLSFKVCQLMGFKEIFSNGFKHS